MGSLWYTIGIDTDKLKKDAQSAAETFKGIGKAAGEESANMTESVRLQIFNQKQLVKSIMDDITKLQQKIKDVPSPAESPMGSIQKNINLSNKLTSELSARERDLASERQVLLVIQQKQVEGNVVEESSQSKLIGSLGKWAMGLATVATAMEIGKSIIESTKETADKFEFAVAGAKAGLDQFWRSIATGDFSNFFDNMTKAIQAGYDFAKAMDEVKKKIWSQEMEEADSQKRKYELLVALRNKLLTKDERIQAGDDLIKLEDELAAKRVNNATLELDAFKSKAKQISGLQSEEIVNTLKQVDETTRIKAEAYNEDIAHLKSVQSAALTAYGAGQAKMGIELDEQAKNLAAGLARAPEQVKVYANALTGVGKMKEEFIIGFVNAYKKVGEAEASGIQSSQRARTTLDSLKEQIKTDAEAAAKKAKDAEGLDNRIAATKKLMDDVKDANSQEFTDLTKKLVVLEQEKKLRQSIVDMQMMVANNKPLEALGATSAIGAIRDMAKALGINMDKTKSLDVGLDTSGIDKQNAKNQKEAAALRKQYHLEEKKDIKDISTEFFTAADAAAQLSQAIGDSNPGLSAMLTSVSKISGTIGNLVKAGAFTEKGMSKGDAVSAAISGATQLIGLAAGQAAENKRIMAEYYASIIAQQQQYNLLLNDQLRINSDITGSVFLKDYQGKLNDSTAAFNDAQKKYQEQMKAFLSSEAIVGKKNVVSGGNILSGVGAGAALGAGIGTIVPVVGTAIGAVVGGIVGGLVGLFAKKKNDITAPLLATYPDLIKANGDFNADLAKTLIANNKVTDATKQTLQNMIDWKDAADKAAAQLKSVISDLSSGLGDDLRNALVDAFKAGSDAADAFKGSVDKVLENIMSNMIFNQAFAGAFKTLEDAMAASYAVGGDQSWLDDFQKFYAQSPELIKNFNQGMADAQTAASAVGFSVFTKPETAATATKAAGLSGEITKTITEVTGTELAGLFRKMSDDGRIIRDYSKIAVSHLDMIQINTLRTADNTDRLEAIEVGIAEISQNTKQSLSSRDLGG